MADESSQSTATVEAPERRPEHRENPPEEHRRSDPRRKRTVRFVLLAFLVVAVLVSIPVYAYYAGRESTDDAQVDGHIIPISPRITGYVLEVLINDNQRVKAGQELVKLDPADYRAALAQAEAQLASSLANATESQVNVPLTNLNTRGSVSTATTQEQQAQAGVAAANQAVNAARAKLNSAKAMLAQMEANLVKAQRDRARYKELVEKDEISKQDYDAAVAAEEANAAQVEAGKADVTQARHVLDQAIAQLQQSKAVLATAVVQRRLSQAIKPHELNLTQARYEQARAAADQTRAALDLAKLNLQYTIIRAPVSGVVSRKTAEPGMQVAAGQQLMALVPLDDIWITANFKETQLRKMRPGQKVEIEVDAYGGSEKYMGHVDSIAAASGAKFSLLPPENATGNYVKVVQRVPVKIVLEPDQNRQHRLVPGMSVVPTVLLNSYVENRTEPLR